MIKNISVFFPCFNEEGNIEQTVQEAIHILERIGLVYEIIIVNDGSTDQTGKIADKLADTNKKIRVIHHPKNLGYGEALKSGFYNAKYPYIVYTDGDGQFDFSEVTKFLKEIENHDLVIGYRIKRQDPFFRILFKKGWKATLFLFFGLTLKDVDCGFKMVRKKVLETIPHLQSQRGAMINAELAIKAKKSGFKIAQVGVNHYPRRSGRPTGANINVILRSFIDLLRLWWKLKDQKFLFILLLAVLLLASFLRFYRLDEYMTFLGDEGRDAIIVKDILTFKNFPLIGPPTSVGNIYLGPIYYYMMAVAMGLFWLNPVAAAGMNAAIGVAAVFLIYYLGKVWFGKISGLISAFLYAISPVAITYSKTSWNPNPTPFFALLAILGIHLSRKQKDYRWLILTGAALAAAIQMHYLALILLPIFAVLFLSIARDKFFWQGTMGGIVAFLILTSPLLIFDLKHDFLNYRAIVQLTQTDTVGGNILDNILRVSSIYSNNLIGRYMVGENIYLTMILSILLILAFFRKSWPIFCLGVWLLVGLWGISFYQKEVYDHYLGFLNPVSFLLLGSLASFKISKNILAILFWGFLLIVLTLVNLQKSPLNYAPQNQLGRTQNVAKFIIAKSQDKPFNFALLAQRNYDAAYQFYLEQYGHKPKQVPFDKTDQLFVVCEDAVCEPIYSAKYEVAAFGWRLVERQWSVYGVKIYKVVHNPEENRQ